MCYPTLRIKGVYCNNEIFLMFPRDVGYAIKYQIYFYPWMTSLYKNILLELYVIYNISKFWNYW